MADQQHMGQVSVVYPDLHRQWLRRSVTRLGEPPGGVIELDVRCANVLSRSLDQLTLHIVVLHSANLRQRHDEAGRADTPTPITVTATLAWLRSVHPGVFVSIVTGGWSF